MMADRMADRDAQIAVVLRDILRGPAATDPRPAAEALLALCEDAATFAVLLEAVDGQIAERVPALTNCSPEERRAFGLAFLGEQMHLYGGMLMRIPMDRLLILAALLPTEHNQIRATIRQMLPSALASGRVFASDGGNH